MPATPATPRWSAWRAVVGVGVVSLAADMVYEGARSITGPFLGSLGATALVIGLVTGAGEGAALILRLVSGPLADRSGRYWSLTILGYAMTAVCVPLMAVAPFVGAAGLVLASALVILERTGKAIRSPAKSALLASAAKAVGRGRGWPSSSPPRPPRGPCSCGSAPGCRIPPSTTPRPTALPRSGAGRPGSTRCVLERCRGASTSSPCPARPARWA